MRRLSALAQGVARSALVVAILLAVNVLAERTNVAADLTRGRHLTLDPQLRELVKSVREPVQISAFLSPGPSGDELEALFRRMRRANRRVRTRFVDPDRRLDVVNRYSIRYYGTVVLEMGGRREDATSPTPQDLATALLRLQRPGSRRVCLTTGHGERTLADEGREGLALLGALLERNGYEPRPVGVFSDGEIPKDCAAVILAGPRVQLADGELDALRRVLGGDGRLLWLVDPTSPTNLDDLAREWGIEVEHGVVVENDPDRRLAANPLLVLVPEYRSVNPIVEGLPGATVFPQAAAFSVADPQPRDGLFISLLARTSDDSYLLRDPAATAIDPARDRKGPLTLAVAADDSRQIRDGERARVERARLVALASVDVGSNLFIGQLANQLLLIRSLNWLTQTEGLVGLRATPPNPEPIVITDRGYRTMVTVNSVVVPLVLVAAGTVTWWWRRRRI